MVLSTEPKGPWLHVRSREGTREESELVWQRWHFVFSSWKWSSISLMNFDLFSIDFCLMLFDGDIKIAVSVLSLCFVYIQPWEQNPCRQLQKNTSKCVILKIRGPFLLLCSTKWPQFRTFSWSDDIDILGKKFKQCLLKYNFHMA